MIEVAPPLETQSGARPAAFLDRDGVINVDHGFTFQPAHLLLTPTAAAGIRLLNDAGYLVIVVTNQSGVARGLYTEDEVHRFHAHLSGALAMDGARIDAFYHAPHHPQGSVARYAMEHEDRKPGAGMLHRAMRDWPILADGSFLIGDKPSDAAAARTAGLPSLIIPSNTGDLLAAARQMLSAHRTTQQP